MIGRVYHDKGEPVVVKARWSGLGPRNVLVADTRGRRYVRPFRGLRRPREPLQHTIDGGAVPHRQVIGE